MKDTWTGELDPSNVSAPGTDRDRRRVMIGAVHVLALAAAFACQRVGDREAAGDVAMTVPLRPAPVFSTDSAVLVAQSQLADGHAWPATRAVTPALRDPARRTPEAVLVGARAAADWSGWNLVTAMLRFEPWLDTRFGGEGHELLARAALARGENTTAKEHASAAVRTASEPGVRAFRTVLLARAYDRLEQRDSAAAAYRSAADALMPVRDWLLLRAAGVTRDTRARERMYESLRTASARARVTNTEAQSLERFGMLLAAANAYEKLGDMLSAYRLRLAGDSDPAVRSGMRVGLLGYLQREARGADLQRGIEILDAAFPRLDATTQLLISRRAAEAGAPARAVAGFPKVPAAMLTDADVIAWARALLALGRPREATTRLTGRRFGAAAAPEALYLRGLALLRRGSRSTARTTLRRVVSAYPSSPEAADALYLLADIESDAGADARARDLLQQSCTRKQPGSNSDKACFRAGILSFALGNAKRAAESFDALPDRFPSSPEATAARYWAGRAYERTGDVALARERWSAVLDGEPLSYYAGPSARRLGIEQWRPSSGRIARSAAFQAAIARAELLDHLGMDTEEGYEYDALEAEADSSAAASLAAGAALLDRGEAARAIRVGWRVVTAARAHRDSAGGYDTRGFQLIYPLLYDSTLVRRARENKLDPAVVAAVIRQESSWNPRAVSRAGARGLMQVMPAVGQEIARSRGYPAWDPALLFQPEVSLELGTTHLRAALSQYNNLPRALAAYNAGASRVTRWARRAGARDPEIFIERIPFVETRDYVRIVMRNAEMYRALYELR